MKASKRGLRRHHCARMKVKARRVFATYLSDLWETEEDREQYLQRCERLGDHIAHCGKPCCNRPRKYEGRTRQERQNLIKEKANV
jgi:hypothetical protein